MGITPTMAIGALGAAGSLGSMFFGDKPQQAPPQQFNYAPQTAGAIGNLGQYNLGAQFQPGMAGIAQGFMNNPYASGYQGAANAFSPMGQGNALQALASSGMMGGMGNAIAGQAFDPQGALYARTANQVSEQALAGLANSGLATTPWGQGAYGTTMGNFNIDWQNQQLQRMMQGGAAAGGLYGGAFNLGNQGWQSGVQAGGMPWGTANAILGGQAQGPMMAANFGNTIAQIPGQQASDYLSMLQSINSANTGNATLSTAQQQQAFNQNQILGRNLGGSLAMMSGQLTPAQFFGGNQQQRG